MGGSGPIPSQKVNFRSNVTYFDLCLRLTQTHLFQPTSTGSAAMMNAPQLATSGSNGHDVLFSRLTKVVKVAKAQGGFMRSQTPEAGVDKTLLNNVSGQALSGKLTALMVIRHHV